MITGAIIAGGPASRFGGTAKGLERVGGERIIDRVAVALSSAADALMIVANDVSAKDWIPGVPVVHDVLDARSSLTGIHAALSGARSNEIVVAWDMPFVSSELLLALRARLEGSVDAVVPWTAAGPEGVCAAYSIRSLSAIDRLARSGVYRLADVIAGLNHVRLEGPALARFGDPAVLFSNVNSPEDLERARGIASSL
jgi:molybdopterin-guanine dinucleotide biosynthesis protein A